MRCCAAGGCWRKGSVHLCLHLKIWQTATAGSLAILRGTLATEAESWWVGPEVAAGLRSMAFGTESSLGGGQM